MSQPQTAPQNTARLALAIGIVGLILGASGLGYALYLGLSQVPSQLSTVSVNQGAKLRIVRLDWFSSNQTGQDRFYPMFITINQGDNVSLIFVTNDTSDAHTFTTDTLAFRGITTANFQLNNSWIGLWSGPFLKGPNGLIPRDANFTGPPNSCTDQNGNPVSPCTTQRWGPSGTGIIGGNCNRNTGINCNLSSTGWFIPTIPGTYRFHCFYHELNGMFGYLNVLPNTAYHP